MSNRITERDIQILASIEEARYLTIEHIQWLHWPSVRMHFRQMQDNAARRYGPNRPYERMRFLKAENLVRPIVRAANRGKTVFARLGNAYTITRAGCDAIANSMGVSSERLSSENATDRSILTLEHGVAIGAVYAALRSELEHRGLQLEHWQGDHRLSRDYDMVTVTRSHRPLPVLPDATFVIDGARYFVEVDRATVRLEQWESRVRAFQAYAQSAALKERYATDSFAVLVVTPSPERTAAIARTVASVLAGPTPMYRFITQDRVHPLSIRRRWQQMGEVRWRSKRLPNGGSTQEAVVTMVDAPPLWVPQASEHTGERG